MVTGAKEAWLTALMHWHDGREEVRDYHIDRNADVEADIKILADAGEKFWNALRVGKEPPLILPSM